MKGITGEERNLVIFKKNLYELTLSMVSSRRDLFIDTVVDRFIFKNNQITLPLFHHT